MTASFKFTVQEYINKILHDGWFCMQGPETKHIGIVMPPGEGGFILIMDKGSTDAHYLVGGHAHSDAGGTA